MAEALPALPEAASGSPAYWDDACRHLARRDRVLKKFAKAAKRAAVSADG